MQPRIVTAAVSIVIALVMSGCANTTIGDASALKEKPAEICIVKNPKVRMTAAIPNLQNSFRKRGIKTTVADTDAKCPCEYRLHYSLRRSWDYTTYLGLAELILYKGNRIVSAAQYKSGNFTLTKWGKTAERIDRTVGKLLGE